MGLLSFFPTVLLTLDKCPPSTTQKCLGQAPILWHILWTHLTRLQSVGYGGGGVQWEVDGMESGGGRPWVGLSPFISPATGIWVPIIGTEQKQEEQRRLLPSSRTSILVVHLFWFNVPNLPGFLFSHISHFIPSSTLHLIRQYSHQTKD